MGNYKTTMGNYKPEGGVTTVREIDTLSSDFTTTSTTYVAITGMSIVIPNQTGGTSTLIFNGTTRHTTLDTKRWISIHDDGSDVHEIIHRGTANNQLPITNYWPMACDGSTMTARAKTDAGTLTVFGDADTFSSFMAVSIY